MHRTKATFIGLLEVGTVNEWVVTEKLGDALKTKLIPKVSKRPSTGVEGRYILYNHSILNFNEWPTYANS